MRITSSWSKDNFVRSGKGFINSLGIKAKLIPKRYKNSRYAIGNVSKKELSKIIREFEKLPYKSYARKRPINEPTDIYLYPAIHLAKCMMRADVLNSHTYPVRTEITVT